MRVKKIYIIVPSAKLESPIKGSIALANELSKKCKVVYVVIKKSEFSSNLLDPKIKFICLASSGNLIQSIFNLRNMLKNDGGKNSVACISFCLSADFYNSFNRDIALTISSVRGNLPKVYRSNYGLLGGLIAYFHLKRLKKLDYVVSMTNSMSKIVESHIDKNSPVIGNFINEESLEVFRRSSKNQNAYKFVFSGSLIEAKMPRLIIIAMNELKRMGIEAKLDIFGEGPLYKELNNLNLYLTSRNKSYFKMVKE